MKNILENLGVAIASIIIGGALVGLGFGIESNRQVARAIAKRDEEWTEVLELDKEESASEESEEE